MFKNIFRIKSLFSLFVLIIITISSCTKDKTSDPSQPQVLSPIFENIDLKMEVVSAVLPGENIKDVYFLNDSMGMIITYNEEIYKTVNGGMTWDLKYADLTSNKPLNQILFVDENVGYVAGGGIILKTADGGETWSDIFDMSDVEFLSIAQNNSGELFVTANGSLGYPSQSFGRILKSQDGGFSWIIVVDTSYGLQRLTFNNGYGYCTGQRFLNSEGTGIIIRSSDNGNSWSQITTALGHGTTDIGFGNDIGYCIADIHTVYKTTDNGENWSPVFDSDNWSYKLNALSANSCLLWGKGPYSGGDFGTYNGAVRQTINSGNTWTEYEFSDISPIQCASFFSQNDGYAITQNGFGLGSILIKVTVK